MADDTRRVHRKSNRGGRAGCRRNGRSHDPETPDSIYCRKLCPIAHLRGRRAVGGYSPGRQIRLHVAGNPVRLVVVAVKSVLAVLGPERIDVDGAIRGLSRYVLVLGIPGDTLDVMAVLGNLADQSTYILSVGCKDAERDLVLPVAAL